MSNTVKPAWGFEPCVCPCSTSCGGKQDVLHAINPQKCTLAVARISRSADAALSSPCSSSMHLPWIQTQTVPDCQTRGSPVRSSQRCVLMMQRVQVYCCQVKVQSQLPYFQNIQSNRLFYILQNKIRDTLFVRIKNGRARKQGCSLCTCSLSSL